MNKKAQINIMHLLVNVEMIQSVRLKKFLRILLKNQIHMREKKGKIIDPLTNEIINMQYDLQSY